MKITEPKTPYVRYNAETDTVEGGTCSPIIVILRVVSRTDIVVLIMPA